MTKRDLITDAFTTLNLIKDSDSVTTQQVMAAIECSRPTAYKILGKLVDLELIVKEGTTTDARYRGA